ncbi:Aldo/keto reductase [Obba rivulosa]|uniref:Aldo/keto reductase n=1 Tax=Obba rivulosa TaxID=1052685 RepID=A0A8E2AM88_9APHY|nr:Aldo/keto reductase [Obba rivulosa]
MFDTANTYSNGLSEVILGNAIKKLGLPRGEVVVFNPVMPSYEDKFVKLTGKTPDEQGLVNQYGLSCKHIFASIKASLERLQLDYVDLLQCHHFDNDTPFEETMQALHDVVKAGYARYIGMSSCYAYQFHAMQSYAIHHNLTPFISMQNQYSLIYREEEREMFPTLKMFGVGSIPWSPLGRGLLTRPFGERSKRGDSDWVLNMWDYGGPQKIVSHVEEISKKRGISMAQVAIAWILSEDGVTAPIVGTTSIQNLEDILNALDVKLTEEEIKYLEEPYRVQTPMIR